MHRQIKFLREKYDTFLRLKIARCFSVRRSEMNSPLDYDFGELKKKCSTHNKACKDDTTEQSQNFGTSSRIKIYNVGLQKNLNP